ncbi:RNA-binding protein [Atopobacter sp. AH10]|uniref:YlmH family RNA-binding protein n=1 Tax=Atopobacter sp. AH10 TaxID=2315861 RepID=UPI000EF1EE99|nr:YlmH/Sll1252 family protein [Atopobacter sp. AH10]RLK62949.1 RNA-binding protein [Atopobacter sp. AH10]
MDPDILQHFKPEEEIFLDRIDELRGQVLDRYAPVLTGFLDPRQQFIARSIIGYDGEVRLAFEGGYNDSERKRAILFPSYFRPETEDYQLNLLDISYAKKFGELSHPQILGALLNTGIDRKYIGDILSDGENWQIVIDQTICPFVMQEATKIGKMKVKYAIRPLTEVILPKDFWELIEVTVTSLRLDSVISAGFHVSRQRAKNLVQQGKVRVNWMETERVDAMLALMDIVSIRGLGRLQLRQIRGRSKKDRIHITLGLLERNK